VFVSWASSGFTSPCSNLVDKTTCLDEFLAGLEVELHVRRQIVTASTQEFRLRPSRGLITGAIILIDISGDQLMGAFHRGRNERRRGGSITKIDISRDRQRKVHKMACSRPGREVPEAEEAEIINQ